MAIISDKIKSIVGFLTSGFEERADDIFEELESESNRYQTDGNYALDPKYNTAIPMVAKPSSESKIVNHPSLKNGEVVVCEPRSYEDTISIVKNLKSKKTIVVNLHLLDKEQSMRIVDFLCGATYALGGSQQKVGDSVFIFTPNNIALSCDSLKSSQRSRIITDALWNQPQ